MLTRNHVELIEIPQRMGTVRKNAADIKMAVDALEMAFERDYVTTFVIGTGDSDFTPLVHKLRELNKRVIGVGIKDSTSAMLPPACDEFLFYETLEGVEVPDSKRGRKAPAKEKPEESADDIADDTADDTVGDVDDLAILIAQTLSGLQRSSGGEVLASTLKRTLLRKDPTFSEADYGFRAFGELLRHLADRNVLSLGEGPARGDPEVTRPEEGGEEEAFRLLASVVADRAGKDGTVVLSGLKNHVLKQRPDFSEKKYGFRGFLQFCRAAQTRGLVTLEWDEGADDYVLSAPAAS